MNSVATTAAGTRLSGKISKEAKGSCENNNNNNDDFIAELESISLRSARGLLSLSQRIQHSNSSLILDKSNIHDETTAIPPGNDLQRLSEYVISSGNHHQNKDNTHGPSPVRNRCVSLDGQNAKHKRNTGRFGYHRSRELALSFDPLNCTAHEIMSYMHATNATIQQNQKEKANSKEISEYIQRETYLEINGEMHQQQEKMNQEEKNDGMNKDKESRNEQEQKVFTDSMRKNKAAGEGESQNGKSKVDQLF